MQIAQRASSQNSKEASSLPLGKVESTEPEKQSQRVFSKAPSQPEITRFACETLRLAYGIHDISGLYRGDEVVHIGETLSDRNLTDPRFVKAQTEYNSLQDRVTKWTSPKDARFATVFYGMMPAARDSSSEMRVPDPLMTEVHDLIGKENIIVTGPFKKFGVVCLKDSSLPDSRPENVVSKKELKEMLSLRKKLSSRTIMNNIKVKGSKEFRKKTLEDFDKMLTFPEGRELIKQLYASKKYIVIAEGESDDMTSVDKEADFKVSLSHKPFEHLGTERGKKAFAKAERWGVLTHELIHVLHFIEDKEATKARIASSEGIHSRWSNKEEYETIGGPKSTGSINMNAFRKRTFNPLRKFHIGRESNGSLDSRIGNALSNGVDWNLEAILKQDPPISKEQLGRIARTRFIKSKEYLLKALISHSKFKEVATKEILAESLNRCEKKGWTDLAAEIEAAIQKSDL